MFQCANVCKCRIIILCLSNTNIISLAVVCVAWQTRSLHCALYACVQSANRHFLKWTRLRFARHPQVLVPFRGVCPLGKTQVPSFGYVNALGAKTCQLAGVCTIERVTGPISHSRKQEYPHTSRLEISAGCTLRPQVCAL